MSIWGAAFRTAFRAARWWGWSEAVIHGFLNIFGDNFINFTWPKDGIEPVWFICFHQLLYDIFTYSFWELWQDFLFLSNTPGAINLVEELNWVSNCFNHWWRLNQVCLTFLCIYLTTAYAWVESSCKTFTILVIH